MTTTQLLRTKLLVPRLGSSHCKREHLTNLVLDNIAEKLILLTAPPGYGKTTLMIDVTNQLDQPIMWYQLDQADNDAATFVAYFVEGLCQTLPDIGSYIQDLLKGAEGLAPIRAMTIIINELLEVPDLAWTCVIDDYHLITNPSVHEIVTMLVENRPTQMQTMIATRSAPSLPLAKWRVRGQLLDIHAEKLRFSLKDTAEWLLPLLPTIKDTDLQNLVEKTEGWGAGIQLALSLIHETKDPASYSILIDKLEGSHPYLFDYLMEEVFERQSQTAQEFLLQSSIFTQLNSQVCDIVLQFENSLAMLENLQRDSLFLFSLDQQSHWFRYHQLFHQFLQNKFQRQSPDLARQLHLRAGEYFAERAEFEEAVNHYLRIKDFDLAAGILKQFGFNYIEQGRVESLKGYLDEFSSTELDKHPELWLMYGRLLRYQGFLGEAIGKLDHVGRVTDSKTNPHCMALALIDLAGIARSQGNYLNSQELSTEAITISQYCSPEIRAFALMENAKSTGLLYGMQGGRKLAEQAIQEAEKRDSQITEYQKAQLLLSLAQIGWWSGDVDLAIKCCRDAIHNTANQQSPLSADIMLMLATPLLYRHEYAEALDFAQKALDICQQLHLQEQLTNAYAVLGNILTRLGELPRAEKTLQQAIDHAENLGASSYAKLMAGGYLAYNLVAQQRIDEAQNILETALWPYLNNPIVYEIYVCRSVLADIYLEQNELAQAETIFAELIELGTERRYDIPLAMAYFGLAYIYLMQNKKAQGLELAQKSVHLLKQARAWELYVDQGQRAVVVCQYLREIMPHDPFIKKVSTELNIPAKSIELVETTQIRIQTLGSLRVFRGNEEILDWTSVKARDMLGYFANFRNEHIPLDRALYDLWPGDLKRGKTAFHTALYRLRKSLRKDTENTKYILSEVGDYYLDVARFDIDVDEFEHSILQSEQTLNHERIVWLETAVSYYNGDYLDNLYYDWLLIERRRLQQLFEEVLSDLYQEYATISEFEKAITTARLLLDQNPLDEEVHCNMMRYFAKLGDRQSIIEQYEQLKNNLESELGVAPLPQSSKLFEQLIN